MMSTRMSIPKMAVESMNPAVHAQTSSFIGMPAFTSASVVALIAAATAPDSEPKSERIAE